MNKPAFMCRGQHRRLLLNVWSPPPA